MPDVPDINAESFFESGRPRHEQLSAWLRSKIEDGTYEVDDQLPSEHQLSDCFGVSRITVRRALQTLEHEGLIYRRQGLGSFVRDRYAQQGLVRLMDFAQEVTQVGLDASSDVLHHAQETAPSDVAAALHLDPDATVARLDCLHRGNGEPLAFDRTWFPLFYAQLLEGHDLTRASLHNLLERDYDIPVICSRYRITAAEAPPSIAGPLATPPHRVLLLIECLSLTQSDKPVYFQRRYHRSDRVDYELELERDPNRLPDPSSGMVLKAFTPTFYRPPGERRSRREDERRNG